MRSYIAVLSFVIIFLIVQVIFRLAGRNRELHMEKNRDVRQEQSAICDLQ
jgi:hypothetical protein